MRQSRSPAWACSWPQHTPAHRRCGSLSLSLLFSQRLTAEALKQLVGDSSLSNRQRYFDASCCPITSQQERAMEQISLAVSREAYGTGFDQAGAFICARCRQLLYRSQAKFEGPCIWPSFRSGASDNALYERKVEAYNNYACEVREVYCGGCRLFLG